ncbi:MAG: phage portal protein [Loktanella sp.]|nr:phage portal protein [Loktanella sp.]
MSAVGTLSRQVRRQIARGLSRLTRSIEAGGGGYRWQGWQGVASPEASTLAARRPARERAAAAALNTPAGSRIVEIWTANLVGKGYQARSQHPDRDTARRLNAEFEALANPALPCMARALCRDGEAFVRIVTEPDGSVALNHLPAEQIDASLTRDLGDGRRIIAGIEHDADDRVVAYHVMRDAPGATFHTFSEAVRVPASDILHVYDQLFPGQVRGLSWLSPVLLKIRDRDEASDALLMQTKTASLMTGFVTDLEGGTAGFTGPQDGGAVNVSLEPGAMRILPPGSDVKFSAPPNGLSQAVEFLRSQDREIASGAGLTFEQLTGDLSGANFSSARMGAIEFRRRAEMLQKQLIEQKFLRPLWRQWIAVKVLAGRIPSIEAEDYGDVRFIGPGWQHVEPLKDANAEIALIGAGLKSREEAVANRGRDIDELDEEIARDTRAAQPEATA